MEENLHGGHRERLRELAFKNNFRNMEDHQLLELLLSYVIPRKDTNPIAHRLIKRYGNFTAVLDADKDDLVKVEGVGNTTASFLVSLRHFFYAYNMGKLNESSKISNVRDAVTYTEKLFKGKTNEEFYIICIDGNNNVKLCENISIGTSNKANVDIKKVVEIAYKSKSPNVIIAHNHPNGVSRPSFADDKLTKAILTTMALSNISLLDHIIIAKSDFFSYRNSGLISQYLKEASSIIGETFVMQPSCKYE